MSSYCDICTRKRSKRFAMALLNHKALVRQIKQLTGEFIQYMFSTRRCLSYPSSGPFTWLQLGLLEMSLRRLNYSLYGVAIVHCIRHGVVFIVSFNGFRGNNGSFVHLNRFKDCQFTKYRIETYRSLGI